MTTVRRRDLLAGFKNGGWLRASNCLSLFLNLLLLFGIAGCGSRSDSAGTSGKLNVVATFSVLGDMARTVGGDQVEVITLVGPDGDAHTFEPTPQDGVALARAAVIFEDGAGFEPWLDRLYASSQSRASRVVTSNGVKLIDAEEELAGGKGGGKHEHEDHDPHVWHDVRNAIQMAENIREGLVKADPAHADQYRTNATAYLQKLKDLDQWVLGQVATLPEARRMLVTNHDTFGYFARRYGFKIEGTALASVSTEAADPSTADFAKLCDAIKATKVPAIFAENVQNSKLMERLAQQTGVRLGPPLFTDALGKEGSDGDTYLKMVRYNVTTIVSQLK